MGKFPVYWKKTTIAFILKKGKEEDPGKYKCVSLTSAPGEGMEQIHLKGISSPMKKLLGTARLVFIKGESCLTNLIVPYDEMTGCVDLGATVGVIYFDFSKASSVVCLQSVKCFKRTMSDGSPQRIRKITPALGKPWIHRLEKMFRRSWDLMGKELQHEIRACIGPETVHWGGWSSQPGSERTRTTA